jgi:hypothetical protein
LYSNQFFTLFAVVRLPRIVARNTQIQILHIFVVIPNVYDFGIFHAFNVGRTIAIGASNRINARQSGVEFGVSIDDVIEFLTTFSKLCAHNANALFGNRVVDVSAISAIMRDIVRVRAVNFDIEHIATVDTELHIEWYI